MIELRNPSAVSRPFLALVLAALAAGSLACSRDGGGETAAPATEAPVALELELPSDAEAAATTITADDLRQTIAALSDDELEGRGPGTAGDGMARRYIVSELEAAGLEPGGPGGSWEQPFEIVGITAEVPETWTFRSAGKELVLEHWEDYIVASGVQRESAAVDDAELVFVGYGIQAPEYGWDDYKDADLRGKVLVMLNNDPDWDPELFEGDRRLYYGRWTYKYESAAAQGAAGAIILHTDASAGYPWQVVQTSWTGPQFELPAGDEPRIEIAAWASWEAGGELMGFAGRTLDDLVEEAKQPDFHPVPLGVRTSLALQNQISRGVETANVLGVLPGSDPEVSDQTVIFTAHHDHLGRGKPDARGDEIYNGARDNASGVAVVLEIARAFRELQEAPRRSILFALVAAEEQGLLGSKYYAAHPTVHPGNLVAGINYDSANIWGPTRDVTFIGYGKSSLDAVAEAAAARQDRVVKGDQFPDRGSYYRSDQFSLAKIGVPAIYFSPGTEVRGKEPGWGREEMDRWTATHYHQQSDELQDDWNLEGMAEDARLGFYAGLHLAETDEVPAWNPGDEFEAARQRALAELGR